jgi:alpha-L-fucosidase
VKQSTYGTTPTLFGPGGGSFCSTEKDPNGSPRFTPSWRWRSTTTSGKIYIGMLVHKGIGLKVYLPAKGLDPIATVLVLNTQE